MKLFGIAFLLCIGSQSVAFDEKAPFLSAWDIELDNAKQFVAPPQLTMKTKTIVPIYGPDSSLKVNGPYKMQMPNGADYCEVIPAEEIKNSKEPLEKYFLGQNKTYSLEQKASPDMSFSIYKTITFPMSEGIEIKCKFIRKEDLAAVEMDRKTCLAQGGTPGTTYRPAVLLRSVVEFDSELKAASKYESCVLKAKPTTFAQMKDVFKKHDLILNYKEFMSSSQKDPRFYPELNNSSKGTK